MLLYPLVCSPSLLIEHVKTLYDFCTLAGSEHFSLLVFFPHVAAAAAIPEDKRQGCQRQRETDSTSVCPWNFLWGSAVFGL